MATTSTSANSGSTNPAAQQTNYDTDYKNWLKSALGLKLVKDAIGRDVEKAFVIFHQNLKGKCGTMCNKCCHKDVEYDKNNKKWQLKSTVQCKSDCQKWITEVSKEHRMETAPMKVYWPNTNMTLWEKEPWEIAKFYMPKGQSKDNTGPDSTDFAAIASLLGNCKVFDKKIVKSAQEVTTFRNNIMHSSDLKVDDKTMIRIIESLVDFLKNLPSPTFSIDKTVVSELDQLKKNDIMLPGEKVLAQEIGALKDRLQQLLDNKDCDQHEEDWAALEKIISIVQDHPDLIESLQGDVEKAVANLQDMGNKVEEMSEVQKQHTEQINLLYTKFEDIKLKKRNRSLTRNHKGSLQYIAQRNKWSLPKYTASPHIEKGGFVASVVVGGKTFELTEPLPLRIDAEQEVAKLALEGLGNFDERSPETGTDNGNGNKPKIDGACSPSRGTTKTVEPSQKYDVYLKIYKEENEQEYHATASMRVRGALQLAANQYKPKKAEAETTLAKLALDRMNQKPVNNPKDFLYGYCGKNGFQVPQYDTWDCGAGAGFTSIIISDCLKAEEDISFVGNAAKNEEEACNAAMGMVKKFLEDFFNGASVDSVSTTSAENKSMVCKSEEKNSICIKSAEHFVSPAPVSGATKHNVTLEVQNFNAAWQATAKVKVTGALQLPTSQMKKKQADAKEATAELVLKKIGKENDAKNGAQNRLYAYCGSSKHSSPKYHIIKGEEGQGFGCVVMTDCLTMEEEISLVGELGSSEQEACKSAEEKVKEFLKSLPGNREIGKISLLDRGKGMEAKVVDRDAKNSQACACGVTKQRQESKEREPAASGGSKVDISTENKGATGTQAVKDGASPQNSPVSAKNYIGTLNEFIQKNKQFKIVKVEGKDDAASNPKKYHFEFTIQGTFREIPSKTYKGKKDAEKHVAAFVLSHLQGGSSRPDPGQAKNLLQEEAVKLNRQNIPKYDSEESANKEFCSSCTLEFRVSPQDWQKEKSQAKQDAARLVLEIIQDQA